MAEEREFIHPRHFDPCIHELLVEKHTHHTSSLLTMQVLFRALVSVCMRLGKKLVRADKASVSFLFSSLFLI